MAIDAGPFRDIFCGRRAAKMILAITDVRNRQGRCQETREEENAKETWPCLKHAERRQGKKRSAVMLKRHQELGVSWPSNISLGSRLVVSLFLFFFFSLPDASLADRLHQGPQSTTSTILTLGESAGA